MLFESKSRKADPAGVKKICAGSFRLVFRITTLLAILVSINSVSDAVITMGGGNSAAGSNWNSNIGGGVGNNEGGTNSGVDNTESGTASSPDNTEGSSAPSGGEFRSNSYDGSSTPGRFESTGSGYGTTFDGKRVPPGYEPIDSSTWDWGNTTYAYDGEGDAPLGNEITPIYDIDGTITGYKSSGSSGLGTTGSGNQSQSKTKTAASPPPDRTPPVFVRSTPERLILTADNQKEIDFGLTFADRSPPLSYQKLSVSGINYRKSSFTHDFSKAGSYDLVYDVCDSLGNCTGDVTVPGFFTVVANVPEWSSSECLSTDGPSKFQLSSGKKISDGVEAHTARVILLDRYGNLVISVPEIKEVEVTFNFRDTNKLDQVTGTGEATVFSSDEFVSLTKTNNISMVKLTDGDSDGAFAVVLKSYSPTSSGYPPIQQDGFDLDLESVDYLIKDLSGSGDVGAVAVNASIASEPLSHFAFYPTLLTIPTALIWNGEHFIADFRGAENITINAIKRFGVYLLNNSSNVLVKNPQIGLLLDSGSDSVIWQKASLEEANSITGLNLDLDLDTDRNQNFDNKFTDLGDWINDLSGDIIKTFRFRATPELKAGENIEGNVVANLQAYSCYTIDTKKVCHRSEKLDRKIDFEEEWMEEIEEEGEAANLYNPGIEILGSIRSGSGTASKQTGAAINQSLGDTVQNEFQDAINRNLAPLLASAGGACSLDTELESTVDWEGLGCTSHNGSVLYFRGADVTLDLDEGLLPSGVRTLVVDGGNLWIKSNLIYPNSSSSLGVIVLGGNIYVYPQVTNLTGAVYAEGGVISVNADGKFGEDSSSECDGTAGFCDRSYELRNQLYWKGLLATANTIGGSDKTAYECPSGVTCDSRETARIYDLSYLRTYHPNSGGLTATGTDSEASFVVEYDSRIQSQTPPLFEVGTGIGNSELGANLLNALKSLWPF